MKNRVLAILLVFVSLSLSGNPINLDSLKQLTSNVNGIEKVIKLNEIAISLAEQDPNIALIFAEEAMQLAKTFNDSRQIANSHNTIGVIFQSKNDYTNAMKSYVEALRIQNDLGNDAGLAESKDHIGQVFFLQENYTQAEENLSEALEILERIKDVNGAALSHKNLADVYLAKEIYGKALEHYRTALDLNLEIEHLEEAAKIANHIGKISTDLGDYDGALVYYYMSRDLHTSMEDLPKIATDFNNIALTLIAQGAYDEAIQENTTAFEIRQEINDEYGKAESFKNFGIIYSKTGNDQKAKENLAKSYTLLQNLKPKQGVPELYHSISKAYANLAEYEKAYANHLAFANSRDLVFNQEKAKALLDLTTKYESEFAAEKQQRTIELLEMENASSKRVRYFLFAVLGLIVTLLLNVFLSNKRKQRDNQLLLAKNEKIQRQHEEIDIKNLELEDKNANLDLLNKKLVDEMAERESIEKSSFARDRFLATMSHEMRTPINIIIGLTHLLLDENPREDQIEHLRTLQFSANNLVVFINDVLDFSKIEAGKLDLESREFSPHKLILDIGNRFETQAKEKVVDMNYDYDQKIPNKLMGDPARLNQIITNLVATSYSYTENGKIDISLELEELNRKTANLKLTIKDTGVKIEQERIDEMYRNLTNPTQDIFDGYASNNLTLAITKRLVDLQKGHIKVNDVEAIEGNQFTVYLPFKIPLSKEKRVAKQKSIINYANLANNKILLVEDNKINQLVVAKMLRKLNIEVVTANDGLLALEEFDKQNFNLVLMDIQMPNMDGYRATAEMRKHADPIKREIPIIALTASAFLTEKEKAKLFGMNDHVGKPFGPDELLDKISSLLEIQKNA
ncbi:MAG: tetratricopeptide repeat protein [Bacteroidetes bacterium]|nr:tetratricopeptide repeat protein [Bacteroidota bacterium]